jgi:hypothetical protein
MIFLFYATCPVFCLFYQLYQYNSNRNDGFRSIEKAVSAIPTGSKCETRCNCSFCKSENPNDCNAWSLGYLLRLCRFFAQISVTCVGDGEGGREWVQFSALYTSTLPFRSCFTQENIVYVLLIKFYHPTKQNKKFNLLLKHVKPTENDNVGIV